MSPSLDLCPAAAYASMGREGVGFSDPYSCAMNPIENPSKHLIKRRAP
jgi:hypothetical protein